MEILLVITVICVLFIILLSVRKGNLDVERRLTDLITRELKDISGNVDISSRGMNEQVSNFIRETSQIKEKMETMQNTVKDISSFQEFFRSPKVRGQWGEANLKHLLQEYFPEELYATQYKFSSGETVDAVLKLPDKKLLPIDSKFPFDNFRKMIEADGEEREVVRKRFLGDVKARIKEISEKYILPSENTVDFGVMYIPAEAVYYEINMASDIDIAEFARSKKVILSSPNTFYLTLRAIEQWFRDTQITREAQDIMHRLSKIEKDGQKLTDDFRKLGGHIKNVNSAYRSSRKRVTLFDKKVKGILKSNKKKLGESQIKITAPEKKEK
jgi:DNA recombination protein RmuC